MAILILIQVELICVIRVWLLCQLYHLCLFYRPCTAQARGCNIPNARQPNLGQRSLEFVIGRLSLVKFCLQSYCVLPKQGKEYAISGQNSLNLASLIRTLIRMQRAAQRERGEHFFYSQL